ncbi:MAG TPA: citrate:proton symporter [Dietzia timorensis]|uniref:Citrate:proton symporter n=1 Tax=Dietzia timorensis TaxID=499555 RepID=A0A921JZL1_9ACTN|nr:citrate:proton symporter [Dietzia timorensis]HJE92043.1 citrate:proton symporter [Dietzia timorensis]
MLVVLGLAMVAVFMYLIMSKRATPVVALLLVPVAFGLFAGAGLGVSDMIIDGIKDLAPTAAMLFFAIIFFGIMIDVGLFDPIVRGVIRLVREDPAKLVVGTAILTSVVSLDGDGSTTFIIVTSALLPLYLKLGVSPVVLTVVAGLANGTMNILPWGGPTARAAAALNIDVSEIFLPMIPSLVVGMLVVFGFAYHLGLMERRRIGKIEVRESVLVSAASPFEKRSTESVAAVGGSSSESTSYSSVAVATRPSDTTHAHDGGGRTPTGGSGYGTDAGSDNGTGGSHGGSDSEGNAFGGVLDPDRDTLRPKLLWVNAALTIALLVVLGLDIVAIPVLFMIASGLALVINFPRVKDQQDAITRHSSSIVSVVAMVLAAAVLTGVFTGTGMVDALAHWLTGAIPDFMGPRLAMVTGILSIPMTFLMSNDAFYFGVLPILTETAGQYGITGAEMARASITGQPVHMQSPLVPAILLLVALSSVSLADHHKKVLWRAVIVSAAMLLVGGLVGVIPF